MYECDGGPAFGLLQIIGKPVKLRVGDCRIGPCPIARYVGCSVFEKIGVENDKVTRAMVERVIRTLIIRTDRFEKFFFRDRGDAMVSKYIVPFAVERFEKIVEFTQAA